MITCEFMTTILYRGHIKTASKFIVYCIKSHSNMINMTLITFSSIVDTKIFEIMTSQS
jgi:hypothetical protein